VTVERIHGETARHATPTWTGRQRRSASSALTHS
jgi:hypothetical protein